MRAVAAARLLLVVVMATAGHRVFFSPRSELLGAFPRGGDGRSRTVALTFDDGPNEPFTTRIGDFLAAEGIAATFFQVGRCVEKYPEVSRRLLSQGHELGNHSYSHSILRCVTPGRQRAETTRAQRALSEATGQVPALYRPPWLLRTPALMRLLPTIGLRPVSGTFCHPLETFQPDARRMARRVLAGVRPGSIVIFHDGVEARGGNREQTAAAVPLVVEGLRSRGYSFVTAGEMLDGSGVPMTPRNPRSAP